MPSSEAPSLTTEDLDAIEQRRQRVMAYDTCHDDEIDALCQDVARLLATVRSLRGETAYGNPDLIHFTTVDGREVWVMLAEIHYLSIDQNGVEGVVLIRRGGMHRTDAEQIRRIANRMDLCRS